MKKSICYISIVLFLLLVGLSVSFIYVSANYLKDFAWAKYFSANEYSTEYLTYWTSDDKKITIAMDNRKEIYGEGIYSATIESDNGILNVEALFGYGNLSFLLNDEKYILDSELKVDYFKDSVFTISIISLDQELSEYKIGDSLTFYKK